MDTWEICLLFTSIVLFRQGECLFQSANNLTWTEAQAFCRRNQSSLIPGTEGHLPYPHWTGLYRRLSDWIHVLGCYDNQSVESLGVLSTHSLDRGSVGLCQERCGSQGRFALKNTTCLCLSSVPQTNSLSPSRCDWSCNPDDESHVNDCGGSDTYNVYKATPRQVEQSEITVNCVVLGCYEQYSQIHTENCTEDLGRICQSESKTNKSLAPDEEDFKSWAETQSECKEEGSYLYGNISLEEDSDPLCGRLYNIRSNTPETWLGVARQVFLTKDRGEENVVIIECQICWGEKNCVLVKGCDSAAQTAYAVCGDATDLLPTTTEPTTTTETHTTSTTEITTSETTSTMKTSTTEIPTTSTTETPTTSTTEMPTISTTEIPTTSLTEIPTTSTTEIPTTSSTEIPTISTSEIPTTSSTGIPTTSTTEIPTTSTTEIPTTSTTEIPTTSTTEIPTTYSTEIPTTSTTEIPTTSTTEIPTTSSTEIPTTSTTEIPTTSSTEIPITSTTEIPTTSTTEIPKTTETKSTSTMEIPTTSTTGLPATTTEMQTTSSTEILTTEAQTLSTTAISTTIELKLTSTTETLTIATTTQETKTEIPTSSENPLTQTTQNFTNTSSMTSSTELPTTKELSTTTENPAIITEIPTPTTTVSQTTGTATVPLLNGKSSSAKQSKSESKAEKAIAVTASLTIVGLILVILGIIWKRRGNLLSNLRRNKDKDATEGTYKHYSSIYDEVILPGEFQKENMYEMEEINDHNSTTTEQLSNGGYTEREGLYENGVPPSKTASLTHPVPNDTVTSSRDEYQNMENTNTKQPQESPPFITVINVPKSQTGHLDNQKQLQYTSHSDRALNNVEKHKSVIQVGRGGPNLPV